ncbi:hypothetical protein RhiirC2_796090 [Rhizophagus irregularis]|uniref:Uncharacterized protein n=1 Tax=Rhizophagus irregularis TaxID=588596 RepID=A0A2N1MAE0_9GLOM|nr:hypothetical protein RhiirC2_796090 [Rhizophagus irregularis]
MARYAISKVFTAGVESTQRVESINGVLKKHLDRGTLLKELVKVIENELDKEAQYNRIRNKSINRSSGILISIDQVKESDNEQSNGIIEHIYDKPQIRLQDLLSDINSDEIQEIWEIYYITVTSSTSTLHYVVIIKDSTLLHVCILSIKECYVNIIAQGNKDYTTKALYYIDQIRSANVYTSNIKERVNKKIEFGSTMLIGLLTQFIRRIVVEERNIPEISNPEYHKPKGHPPKQLTEEHVSSSSKTCSYCLEKGHNIKGCRQHKADLVDKENNN